MSLFLFSFLLLYGGMHYYWFRKLIGAFTLPPWAVLFVILLMTFTVCAPILVRVAERGGMGNVAVFLALAGYTWMGILFLFFIVSVIMDSGCLLARCAGSVLGRDFSTYIPGNRLVFLGACAISAVVALYGYFEALSWRTERVVLETGKLPSSIKSLRIVQISDVHLGPIVGAERLRRIIGKIEEARPDILVSTGDLVDGQMDGPEDLAAQFGKLNPRYGKYAVTGNHEYYAGLEHAMDFAGRAGFTVLHGKTADAGGVLAIAGVDDPAGRASGVPAIPEKVALEKAGGEKFVLLLKHRPVAAEESEGLFDLQLSGHIHKGQIFPFGLVTRLFYPVSAGFSRLGGRSALYVSRGTGTWGPPIRFLAPPEITVIELVREENRKGRGLQAQSSFQRQPVWPQALE